MSKRQFSLIGNWLVPDVLRPKPTPQWRQPLAESGTPWQRLGRLLWRAYRFAQPTGRSLVPGPAFDVAVVSVTAILAVACLIV